MRTRFLTIICLALLPFCLVQAKDNDGNEKSSKTKVFTGISGGLSVHGGYLFSDSPDKLFSNTGLGDLSTWKSLRTDGFCYGFGAQLRIHLINHIHVGAEAHMSNMPLMKTGSNVSSTWAGGFVDFYGGWGKVKPMVGLGIGGGKLKRLYVPEADAVDEPAAGGEKTTYNSSYITTPFFYLDPYIGIETNFGNILGLQFKIDYLLPFGKAGSSLADAAKSVEWSSFLTPSGPRLHIALLFGQLGRK